MCFIHSISTANFRNEFDHLFEAIKCEIGPVEERSTDSIALKPILIVSWRRPTRRYLLKDSKSIWHLLAVLFISCIRRTHVRFWKSRSHKSQWETIPKTKYSRSHELFNKFWNEIACFSSYWRINQKKHWQMYLFKTERRELYTVCIRMLKNIQTKVKSIFECWISHFYPVRIFWWNLLENV